MPTKVCSKCGIEKTISEFLKHKTNKDRLMGVCRGCHLQSRKEYRKQDYVKKKEMEYRKRTATHRKEYNDDYWNRPDVKERRKQYDLDRRESQLIYWKKYDLEHKEEKKVNRQAFYKLHWVEIRKIGRERYKNNREKYVANKKRYSSSPKGKLTKARGEHKRRSLIKNTECTLTLEQWKKIIILQENKCTICGKKFTKKNPATKDHIIPIYNGGDFTFENTQAVHMPCNSRKNAKIDISNIVSWVTRPDLCITTEQNCN